VTDLLPRHRIGMIGPTPDAPFIYYQFYRAFPPGGLLIHSSLNLGGFSAANVDAAFASYWNSLAFLQTFHVHMIMLGGVPLSAVAGRPRMLELLAESNARAGIPVTTDFEEVIAKWKPEVMQQTADYLAHAGIEVVSVHGHALTLHELHELNMEQSLEVALQLGRSAFEAAPQADGLLLLGGHWLVMQAVVELEAAFGKPAITNPGAMYWAALRERGERCATPGMGALLESLG
jgi:maleate cis-trans isomerase